MLTAGDKKRLHERQVMVMVWIMAIPHEGTSRNPFIKGLHDQFHNRGTLRKGDLAFQEEMDENR